MRVLQLGASLSDLPLSLHPSFSPHSPPFLIFTFPRKVSILLHRYVRGAHLGCYKQARCRQGLNLTASTRWLSDHIPGWLSGCKGNRIYCTETQQQQKPVRSLRSFMYRNKNFRAAWRYEIFLNYFLLQYSLRIFLLFLFLGLFWWFRLPIFFIYFFIIFFYVTGSKPVLCQLPHCVS